MKTRLHALTAALILCSTQAWATMLPTNETYSSASDIGSNSFGSGYTPLSNTTSISGVSASISGSGYAASASTTSGNNHTYAQGGSFPTDVFGATSFSGWYDQITITGGTGTGTAQFTVQLNGIVDVGAIAGGMSYTLGASSIHPSQLTSSLTPFQTNPPPWALDAATPIASYLMGVSPYNDTSILFPTTANAPLPAGGISGIPSVGAVPLPPDGGIIGVVTYDQILTPGAGQVINTTLHGTFNFIYDEPFYLIGALSTDLLNLDAFQLFCSFTLECPPPPAKDGTGATTLDFSHSAHLIDIGLPDGATASSASGTRYNAASVPEPSSIALAGLGLIGMGIVVGRTRRRI
jgi:hypothetical protein